MVLTSPIHLKDLKVEPAPPGSGLRINGIPVDIHHVVKADSRVDLAQGNKRAFVVEHVLAPLKLLCIEDAEIVGLGGNWDFARPVHRFAYCLGMDLSSVFGPADGRHQSGIFKAVCESTVSRKSKSDKSDRHLSPTKKVRLQNLANDAWLELFPLPRGSGLDIELIAGDKAVRTIVWVTGERKTPDEVIDRILTSRTPAVHGLNDEEALWHATGDFIADLAGVGGLTDAKIVAHLEMNYHRLTIGALRVLFGQGVLPNGLKATTQ